METSEIIARIIVGALAGAAAASVMGMRGRSKSSMTVWLRNTIIGIIGGLVGGFLLGVLDVDLPEFLDAAITLADLLIAFIGAIIVIFLVGLIRKA